MSHAEEERRAQDLEARQARQERRVRLQAAYPEARRGRGQGVASHPHPQHVGRDCGIICGGQAELFGGLYFDLFGGLYSNLVGDLYSNLVGELYEGLFGDFYSDLFGVLYSDLFVASPLQHLWAEGPRNLRWSSASSMTVRLRPRPTENKNSVEYTIMLLASLVHPPRLWSGCCHQYTFSTTTSASVECVLS